ncbi:MAG: hypothetical protein KDA60_11690, partial [Planctomycetales bacterium]|nr:hypothetical protein [Planctomycetales bacterium]
STDVDGNGSFDIVLDASTEPGEWITATATEFEVDVNGVEVAKGTSEFSAGTATTVARADFNGDGVLDTADIDELFAEIVRGTHVERYDLDADGLVDLSDRDAWLAAAGATNLPTRTPYPLGDADLDGIADATDYGTWSNFKFTQVTGWSRCDFNADGHVDVKDFNIWNANKYRVTLSQYVALGVPRNPRAPAVVTITYDVAPAPDTVAVDMVMALRAPSVLLSDLASDTNTQPSTEGVRSRDRFGDGAVAPSGWSPHRNRLVWTRRNQQFSGNNPSRGFRVRWPKVEGEEGLD